MSLPYDKTFFDLVDDEAARSASVVVPIVCSWLKPGSVLDVGSGNGGWTAAFVAAGVTVYLCVDGDYVDRNALRVPADHFKVHDLTKPLDLGRRFDLAVCLEVGEHLPEAVAASLVSSLTRHADAVLFSSGIPHQKGTNHINLQWPAYWAELFASQGYSCFDCIRPRIWSEEKVSCWYKQNAMLYLNNAGLQRATEPDLLKQSLVNSPHALVHPEVYMFNMQEAFASLNATPPLPAALRAVARSANSLARTQAKRILRRGK